MKRLFGKYMSKFIQLAVLLAIFGGALAPATAGSAYSQNLAEMSVTLSTLVVRAERLQPRDVEGIFKVRQELFELSKRLHVLEEEAAGTNLAMHNEETLRIERYCSQHP